MNFNRFLCVAIGCTLVQGCGPIVNATRTLAIEPIHYCRRIDALVECHRNHDLAEQAWADFQGGCPGDAHSADFAKGFKQGFADFLFAGGTGAPPPLPPRHYWGTSYQSPEGRRATEDWFEGFRQGAATARESGLRQYIVVPSSVGIAGQPHGTAVGHPHAEPTVPAEPVLPAPRPLKKGPPEEQSKRGKAPLESTRPWPAVRHEAAPRAPVAPVDPVEPMPEPVAQESAPPAPAGDQETAPLAPGADVNPTEPMPVPATEQLAPAGSGRITRVWYSRRHHQTEPPGVADGQEAAPLETTSPPANSTATPER